MTTKVLDPIVLGQLIEAGASSMDLKALDIIIRGKNTSTIKKPVMEGLLRWLLRIGKAITEGMEGDQNIVKAKEAFKQGMAARKEFEEKNNITMEPLRDPEEEDGSANKDEEENANKEEKRAEEKKPVCNWYKRGNCRFGERFGKHA